MTYIGRRKFLLSSAAVSLTPSLLRAAAKPFRIGITDWNLYLDANPDAVALAKKLNFEGVQVSCGRKIVDGKMPMDNPEVIARYRSESKRCGIPLDGTCVDRLHDNGLKDDPLALKWVDDAIRLTRALDIKVILLPFFGKHAIKTPAERDRVGDAVRELAPHAEKANVILGLEDTISAEDNVRIMDRGRSKNVLVYYDVGNSTENGFDIVKEIRWLGKDRICQIHLKDNPHFMGAGPIQFEPVIRAIRDIGFTAFANLETDVSQDDLAAGLEKNLRFTRSMVEKVYKS